MHVGFTRHLGDGPMWRPAEVENCEDNWWANMLYMNNFYKDDKGVSLLGALGLETVLFVCFLVNTILLLTFQQLLPGPQGHKFTRGFGRRVPVVLF